MNVMMFVYVLTIAVFIDYDKSGNSSLDSDERFSDNFNAEVNVPTISVIGLNSGIDPTADFSG